MKKVMKLIAGTVFCAAIATGAYAQSPAQNTPVTGQSNPVVFPQDQALTDQAMSQQLQTDLQSRNQDLGNTPVNWYNSGSGYYGTYSINGKDYMSFYDRDRGFIETYQRGDWNDTDVSPDLKTAYNNSQYKSSDVAGYWTSTDPEKKRSYFEVKNKQGKMSRVYSDENGKFSSMPPSAVETAKKPRTTTAPDK